jgi:hypothetical protein
MLAGGQTEVCGLIDPRARRQSAEEARKDPSRRLRREKLRRGVPFRADEVWCWIDVEALSACLRDGNLSPSARDNQRQRLVT